MKILTSYHYFYPHKGGGEQAIFEISKRLVQTGDKVTVITSSSKFRKPVEYIEGIRVVSCKKWFDIFKTAFMPGIFWKLLTEDCDVIHAHLTVPFTSEITCLVAKLRRKPLIVTYHFDGNASGQIGNAFAWMYNHTFNKLSCWLADSIVATTGSYAQTSQVLKNYIGSDKLCIIPLGVDIERFNCRSTKKHELKKIILFVGRLSPYKGLDLLLKAMKNIDAKLVMVGSGNLKESLKEKSKELGIEEKVLFAGFVDDKDLPKFYSNADVFVLPSQKRGEAFGLVSLEAMASGKPVVYSNVPGVRDVVPKNCGLMFNNSADDLSKKVNILLKDNKLRKRLGINGRNFVEKERNWDIITRKYSKLINSYKSSE